MTKDRPRKIEGIWLISCYVAAAVHAAFDIHADCNLGISCNAGALWTISAPVRTQDCLFYRCLYFLIISKTLKDMMEIDHITFMTPTGQEVTSVHLSDIAPDEIITHMSDPRMAEHMPLLTFKWDQDSLARFIATKEAYWRRDGLGHWAILCDGVYAGWGGFQKEGNEWDFGLVLKPNYFGLGMRIAKKAIEFAKADERIPFITFLLPPSRNHLGGIARLGAWFVGEVKYADTQFRKYRLDTK